MNGLLLSYQQLNYRSLLILHIMNTKNNYCLLMPFHVHTFYNKGAPWATIFIIVRERQMQLHHWKAQTTHHSPLFVVRGPTNFLTMKIESIRLLPPKEWKLLFTHQHYCNNRLLKKQSVIQTSNKPIRNELKNDFHQKIWNSKKFD